MDPAVIKEWLVPVSTFVTLITASIGGWKALKEYRLKVQAEIRLTRSSELEADIKLLKLFTEIMNIAHARGGYQVSEKAIEMLLSPETIKSLGLSAANVKKAINTAIIHIPVGMAAQDAAISAIWVLGNRHETLKPVAIQALMSLTGFKEKVATPYLKDLQTNYRGTMLATADHK